MPLTGFPLFALLATGVFALPAAADLPTVPGVTAQRLPTVIRVNGVAIEVQRFEGASVPALAVATERQWGVSAQRQGSWWQLARVQGAWSEVLQWRQSGANHEALYSRLLLTRGISTPPRRVLALPAGCGDEQQLDIGDAYQPVLQLTARCSGSPLALRAAMQRAASRAGWQPIAATGSTLHWTRPGWQLQVQVLPTTQGLALLAMQWRVGISP